MIHTTSSGTQGIANATKADEILTGSFVNAQAIINYIRKQNPEKVSLVCMGYSCQYPTDEDTLLAVYIKNELSKESLMIIRRWVEQIREGDGARFFAPEKQKWAPTSRFRSLPFTQPLRFCTQSGTGKRSKLFKKSNRIDTIEHTEI